MRSLGAKYAKNTFAARAAPDPAEAASSAPPDPLAGFNGSGGFNAKDQLGHLRRGPLCLKHPPKNLCLIRSHPTTDYALNNGRLQKHCGPTYPLK